MHPLNPHSSLLLGSFSDCNNSIGAEMDRKLMVLAIIIILLLLAILFIAQTTGETTLGGITIESGKVANIGEIIVNP